MGTSGHQLVTVLSTCKPLWRGVGWDWREKDIESVGWDVTNSSSLLATTEWGTRAQASACTAVVSARSVFSDFPLIPGSHTVLSVITEA